LVRQSDAIEPAQRFVKNRRIAPIVADYLHFAGHKLAFSHAEYNGIFGQFGRLPERDKLMTTVLQKPRAEPAYRLVANAIRDHILDGTVKPGDPLPSESALAQQLGVNRSTLREGIRLLEANGLVRRRGGKRLFANVPLGADLSARISHTLVLQAVTFRELWETHMAIEPPTAGFAALRREPADLAALEANLQNTRDALARWESVEQLDIEFHSLVAQSTRNRALVLCRDPLSLLFYPAYAAIMHPSACSRAAARRAHSDRRGDPQPG
jgi:GntR family transcriptional regulator, transcriptional repressor for pyruvate dehydrogenase complex